MLPARIKAFVNFIEEFSKNASLIEGAEVLYSEANQKLVKVFYSKEDIKHNARTTVCKQYITDNFLKEYQTLPYNYFVGKTLCQSYSQSREKLAVLQQKKKKEENIEVLEIYHKEFLDFSLNLSQFHKKVLSNSIVGNGFSWSSCENSFVYVAVPKEDDKNCFFLDELEDEKIEKAVKNKEYEADFGENCDGIKTAKIYSFDVKNRVLNEIILPENIFPMYPLMVNENEIVFCGYSKIFPKEKKDKDAEKEVVEKDEKDKEKSKLISLSKLDCAWRPFISPDNKKIAFFSAPMRTTHQITLGLYIYNLENQTITEIFPMLEKIDESSEFAGFAGYFDELNHAHWLSNSEYIVFDSFYKMSHHVYIVDCQRKKVQKLSPTITNLDYWSILNFDRKNNCLALKYTCPQAFSKCFIGEINCSEKIEEIAENFKKNKEVPKLSMETQFEKLIEQVFEKIETTHFKEGNAEGYLLTVKNYGKNCKLYNEIFKTEENLIENIEDQDKPLVLLVHGGPHGNVAGMTFVRRALLISGFNVLFVNFTGSCGYGQQFTENLIGKIGTLDAEEIVGMIKQIVSKKLCNPDKISTLGGSYGGYMSGILTGKYKEIFKCGVLLNPVLNIAFNTGISDIPEWSWNVVFGEDYNLNIKEDHYKKMYEVSPFNFVPDCPLLLMLGAKDRRVPYQQGLAYATYLKKKGKDIRTYIYPESNHALCDSVETEYDVCTKILLFLIEQNLN